MLQRCGLYAVGKRFRETKPGAVIGKDAGEFADAPSETDEPIGGGTGTCLEDDSGQGWFKCAWRTQDVEGESMRGEGNEGRIRGRCGPGISVGRHDKILVVRRDVVILYCSTVDSPMVTEVIFQHHVGRGDDLSTIKVDIMLLPCSCP